MDAALAQKLGITSTGSQDAETALKRLALLGHLIEVAGSEPLDDEQSRILGYWMNELASRGVKALRA
jgi:hypothetical protein